MQQTGKRTRYYTYHANRLRIVAPLDFHVNIYKTEVTGNLRNIYTQVAMHELNNGSGDSDWREIALRNVSIMQRKQ